MNICPKCGTAGEVVQFRKDDPTHIISCPACFHEWEASSAYEVMQSFRAQLQIHHTHKRVLSGIRSAEKMDRLPN